MPWRTWLRLSESELYGRIESKVLDGFWIKSEWLWEAATLNRLEAFCETRGLSPENAALVLQLLKGTEE